MKMKAMTALLALCSSAALADGDVIIDLAGNSNDLAGSLIQGSDGRLYLTSHAGSPVNRNWLLAFEANGTAAANFGTNGRTQTPRNDLGTLAMRPDGSLITGGGSISTYSPTGVQLSSVLGCGEVNECPGFILNTNSYLPNADGSTWGGGGYSQGTAVSHFWTLKRITPAGLLDPGFAGGVGWTQKDGGGSSEITALRRLSNGQIIAVGTAFPSRVSHMSRFNADGATDFTFGINGLVSLGTSAPYPLQKAPLAIDSQQRFLVAGEGNVVARRNSDGSPDNTYTGVTAVTPTTTYRDFVLDSAGRVVVFAHRQGQVYVARLLVDGGLDPTFGNGGEAVLMPPAAAATATGLTVSTGIVDSADRPIAYFQFISAGRTDIGLVRLTTSGVLDTTFGAGWTDADTYPDAFTFDSNTAPFGTSSVVSNTVLVGGFNSSTSVQLTATTANSAYSIGCNGTWMTAPSEILPGQSICLRHAASDTSGASVTTSVSIGGRVGTYTTTSTAVGADVTPDAFNFTDQNNVALGTTVTSSTVTITGISGASPIGVDFGQYSINCDPAGFRATGGTITNGQTVCLRVTASGNFSTAVSATLAIGGVTDTFTATTLGADTTPDAFTFTNQNNVAVSSVVTSNAVTIAGINSPAAITVTGGEYSIGCNGTFTAAAGSISSGQGVCVRHTASALASTTLSTTLTVGGTAASFSSTTAAAVSPPPSNGGGGGGALSVRDLVLLGLFLLGAQAARHRTIRREPHRSSSSTR